MNKHTVRLAVELTINEGKSDEFQRITQAMIAGTQKESGALAYDFYLSGDRRRCRLLKTYADSNAVLAHFTGPVVREFVPKLLEFSRLIRFEVYGDPGPEAAQMLAGFGVETFKLSDGVRR